MDIIKQIKIYPPANDGTSRILVIYEVEDVLPEEHNGHYLSIDLGLHNLMTCYDNVGKTFIIETNYPAFIVPRGFKCRNNREINDTHTNLTTSIYYSKPSSITSPVESKRTELRALR